MTASTHPIVIGTAGHIDHGKTALVTALTGIDTDRLKVEKERGITTELGFAHVDLGGRRFGVVDVPGHERFIRSMVAGAGGLDLVCLVIAADEGVMPQTREHLDICELLAVRRGVVALSKADLVDDEWIAMMTAELRGALAGSFLADAAVLPVSARTGAGLDALRAELSRLATTLPVRSPDGVFRLPLDRVFTIRGFGTVVTGTIASGTVRVGDAVSIHPRGLAAKVRGIQIHGAPASEGRAGMRCAINLAAVGTDEVRRGDVLGHPDALAPSHIVDVQFRLLPSTSAPLGRRTRVLLHHGTAQLPATLVLVGADTLEPGASGLAQLRLDATTPLVALPGDRFIARGFVVQASYGTTLGGGQILRVLAPKARRAGDAAAQLAQLAQARDDDRIALEVKSSAAAGLDAAGLTLRLGFGGASLAAALGRLVEAGELARIGAPDAASSSVTYLHAGPLAMLEKRLLEHLDAFHAAHPQHEQMSREELRARLPPALSTRAYEYVLAALVRRGAIETEADRVRRARGGRLAPVGLTPLEDELAARYRAWAAEPKRPAEVPAELGADPARVRTALEHLLQLKVLVRVKPDFYIDAGALDALRTKLVEHLAAHGQITAQEWKEIVGASRKYTIPLAEHFDAEKLTLRVGEIRKKR